MIDLLSNPHINAAIYFTDQGQYIFKYKKTEKEVICKSLRAPEVSASFTRSSTDSGWVPEGIKRVGYNHLGKWFVFFAPPCKQFIQINTSKKINIPIPATILIGKQKKYHLFSLASSSFDPKAMVFHAPFPNVYADGSICWGKNAAPKVNVESALGAWELFFAAPFNGDLSKGKSKSQVDDVRLLLKKLAERQDYPVDDLVFHERSVDTLIKKLLEVDE